MTVSRPWLQQLTLDKLHRLATALGLPCSGTKSARIEGIRRATSGVTGSAGDGGVILPNLSLLSIDMGIRNLAFAHITATAQTEKDSRGGAAYGPPTIQAWHRLAVPHSLKDIEDRATHIGQDDDSVARKTTAREGKETFEPIDYSAHAYDLISYMLRTYKPNQVLIERQRFRSGGQSAVQEWTIRVGMFEGMLYAVLRTLIEERKLQLSIEPMQPARVNRYWLDGRKKLTGREVKRAKIDLVSKLLDVTQPGFIIGPGLKPFMDEFMSTWKNGTKSKKAAGSNILKLDDLADSLLQGLAWVNWQNNRRRIGTLGPDAVDMESGSLL